MCFPDGIILGLLDDNKYCTVYLFTTVKTQLKSISHSLVTVINQSLFLFLIQGVI
jgi:hypothetical protein